MCEPEPNQRLGQKGGEETGSNPMNWERSVPSGATAWTRCADVHPTRELPHDRDRPVASTTGCSPPNACVSVTIARSPTQPCTRKALKYSNVVNATGSLSLVPAASRIDRALRLGTRARPAGLYLAQLINEVCCLGAAHLRAGDVQRVWQVVTGHGR